MGRIKTNRTKNEYSYATKYNNIAEMATLENKNS